jgi:hypothetical protein
MWVSEEVYPLLPSPKLDVTTTIGNKGHVDLLAIRLSVLPHKLHPSHLVRVPANAIHLIKQPRTGASMAVSRQVSESPPSVIKITQRYTCGGCPLNAGFAGVI